MKKITMLVMFFTAWLTYGQITNDDGSFTFPIEDGPILVVNDAGTSLEINDEANSAGVPDGLYDSYEISFDWSNDDDAYSSESRVEVVIASGTTGTTTPDENGSLDDDAEVVFEGDFDGIYNPDEDGNLELLLDQSWNGSSANWSNIEVTIFESPTCIDPLNLDLIEATTSTADVEWEAGSNNEDSYDWIVVENGDDVEDENNHIESGNTTSTNVVVSGLNESTSYDFYVSADCGNDDLSSQAGPLSFNTQCEAFGDFETDFSDETTGDVPLCWTGITNSEGNAPNLEVTTLSAPNFGDQQVRFQSSNDADTEHILVSPALNNLSNNDKRVRFSARQVTASHDNVMEIGTMSNPDDENTFTVIETVNFDGNDINDYSTEFIDITGDQHFAFRVTFSSTFSTVVLDRVIYEDLPECIEPTSLELIAAGLDFIDVQWEASSTAVEYEIVYGEEGFDPDTEGDNLIVDEEETDASILGLEEGSTYEIYVRALCANDEESIWTDPITANTLTPGAVCGSALVVDQIPFTDSGATEDFGNNYSGSDRPDLGGEQVAEGTGSPNYLNGPDVVYSFTPDQDGVFNIDMTSSVDGWIALWLFEGCEPFTSIVGRDTATSGDSRSLPELNLTAGETYYVVITGWTVGTGPETYDYTLNITEVECPSPFGLELSSVNLNEATIDWNSLTNANSYDWIVVEIGNDVEDEDNHVATGNTTTNSTTVDGLNASTQYEFYVAGECNDATGDLSDPLEFATQCDTFGDFETDFSGEVTGDVPLCWTGITNSEGASPNLEVTTFNAPNFGNQQVRFQSSGDEDTEHFLVTPQLNNLSETDKRVLFSARQVTASHSNVMEVGTMSNPDDESTFTVIETVNFEDNNVDDYVAVFSDISDDEYIAFRVTFSNTSSTVVLDRVVYEDNPTCNAVSDLVADNFTTDGVDLTWEEVDEAEEYTWFVFEEGDNPEEDTAFVTGTTTEANASVTGLDPGETYIAVIETDCGEDGVSVLSDEVVFSTECLAQSYPFLETFEDDSDTRDCWTQIQEVGSANWTFQSGSSGGAISDAFEGSLNARFVSQNGDNDPITKLVTPQIDMGDISQAELSFSYGQEVWFSDQNELKVYYRLNTDQDWIEVAHYTDNVSSWTQETLTIPETSETLQIAFEGINNWGRANIIDDVSLDEPDPVFANVQVIHNSPDSAASSVDVYLNGELLPELTGVDFRTASEFLEVPAEEEITIDIVPAGEDLADSVFTQEFTLDEDENYIIVANGFLGADFELSVFTGAQQTSDEADETAVLVHHGSPDAPVVNVANQETGDNLVTEIAFTEFAGYLDLLTDDYTLDITDVDGNVVSSYLAPLSDSNLSGEAITVIASGILTDPDLNNAFGLWVATAAGGDLIELPLIEPDPIFANVQVIHNSPDPAAASVDVFLNGEPVTELSDVAFRNASQFLPVPAEVEITIDIVPAGGELGDSVHTENFTLEEDENYIIVANGVLDSDDFVADATFGLDVFAGARTVAEDESLIDVLVHHGSPDAPAVDVGVQNDGIVVNNIAYPEFEGYLEVDENDIVIELFATGETDPVGLYQANLAELNLAGSAITVVASGFFGDDAEADNEFGLWVATAAGGALIELTPLDISTTDFDESNFSYYPVPVKANLNIKSINTVDQVEVFNTLGQRVISVQPRTDMPVIDMQSLQTGVYLMKVSINGNEETFQIIKE